jgi:hypothetical protein
MTELERWQAGNDQYLASAVAWVRLRLTHLSQQAADHASPSSTSPLGGDRRRWFRRAPTSPTPGRPIGEQDLRQAALTMDTAEASLKPPPALRLIGDRLGLSPFERQVLLLCAAMELDTRTAGLCAQAHGQPHPTFALALALFDNPAWDVLSPERPLRYWRLIEINQPGAQPLTASPLRADERVVNAIKGLNYLDDRLSPLMLPLGMSALSLAPSQEAVAAAAVTLLRRQADSARRWHVVELVGRDARSLGQVAGRIAAALGLPLYRLPVGHLPGPTADLESAARLWQREALLAPVALYLDAHDLDEKSPQQPALLRFLARIDGVTVLGAREVWPDLGRPALVLDVAKPTLTEQQQAWAKAIGARSAEPGPLAAQFDLDLETIASVARDALDMEDDRPFEHRLWDGCRRTVRPRMETLAQRIDARATWNGLVLPEPELRLLRQLADQVRARARVYADWGFAEILNRGLGISALFAGESGTGKTTAAEVIANELRLDLYRIDLASVVSKYIGETEKNLRRLFDAAEDGGAILFFDEADALFGKRSEVKDAHDRYANIEINYLLQRMEGYRGLAILATNMKGALDPAFTRRLRFIVRFPFPSLSDRRRIWAQVFPAGTPTRGLDYDRLARLNLTGAGIRDAALAAAFVAAKTNVPVTMREVLDAARSEFKKLERPINEADFRMHEVGA